MAKQKPVRALNAAERHRLFVNHLLRSLKLIFYVIIFSLALGILGYRLTEGYEWIDCLLNSAMLLGGMGQINELKTFGGKLFASFYAIYGGLVIIGCTGIMFGPVMHHILRIFHADDAEDKK